MKNINTVDKERLEEINQFAERLRLAYIRVYEAGKKEDAAKLEKIAANKELLLARDDMRSIPTNY